MSGARSSQQQQQDHHHQQQHQPLFPKQATVAFSSPMHLTNTTQLASSGVRGAWLELQILRLTMVWFRMVGYRVEEWP
ncbi:unnamed protein product, partial [Vitis vinifera]